VKYWSIVQTILLAGVCGFQVFYLKRFFEVKRVVVSTLASPFGKLLFPDSFPLCFSKPFFLFSVFTSRKIVYLSRNDLDAYLYLFHITTFTLFPSLWKIVLFAVFFVFRFPLYPILCPFSALLDVRYVFCEYTLSLISQHHKMSSRVARVKDLVVGKSSAAQESRFCVDHKTLFLVITQPHCRL